MKNKEIRKRDCPICEHQFPEDTMFRFTWRYNDKLKTYISSGRKMVHTGYTYLCYGCVKDVVNILK